MVSSRVSERDLKDSIVSLTRENSNYSTQVRLMRDELTQLTEQERHWSNEYKTTIASKQQLEGEVARLKSTIQNLQDKQSSEFSETYSRISHCLHKEFEDLSIKFKLKLPSSVVVNRATGGECMLVDQSQSVIEKVDESVIFSENDNDESLYDSAGKSQDLNQSIE